MNDFSSLQYITTNSREEKLLKEVEELLHLGVRWIQLRLTNISEQEYREHILLIKPLIEEFNATLIINDNLELALEFNTGIHLGKNDFPIQAAKKILPKNTVIGATCNTTEDIVTAIKDGASYIGLGPFKYTETKKNLSPILKEAGLIEILADLGEMSLAPNLTLVGGIKLEDLSFLSELGIKSIAVSSLLAKAENKNEVINYLKDFNFL